jgi:hypothetical protein
VILTPVTDGYASFIQYAQGKAQLSRIRAKEPQGDRLDRQHGGRSNLVIIGSAKERSSSPTLYAGHAREWRNWKTRRT